jgi:hypothetical protein
MCGTAFLCVLYLFLLLLPLLHFVHLNFTVWFLQVAMFLHFPILLAFMILSFPKQCLSTSFCMLTFYLCIVCCALFVYLEKSQVCNFLKTEKICL